MPSSRPERSAIGKFGALVFASARPVPSVGRESGVGSGLSQGLSDARLDMTTPIKKVDARPPSRTEEIGPLHCLSIVTNVTGPRYSNLSIAAACYLDAMKHKKLIA